MRTASIEDGRVRLFVLAELLSARLAVGRDVYYERFGDGGELAIILVLTARESLILIGVMSEWLKEHAWK